MDLQKCNRLFDLFFWINEDIYEKSATSLALLWISDDDDDDKFILFPFFYFTMTTILTLVEILKENFVYFTKCQTK